MTRLACAALLFVLPSLTNALEAQSSRERDSVAVRTAFLATVAAHNAQDLDAMMTHFAEDAVLSYPGMQDTGLPHKPIREGFRKHLTPRPGIERVTSAEIEEILVSGDIAIVRALWTVESSREDPPATRRSQEKDLEVWRRQPDGRWQFVRGISFPWTAPRSAGAAP